MFVHCITLLFLLSLGIFSCSTSKPLLVPGATSVAAQALQLLTPAPPKPDRGIITGLKLIKKLNVPAGPKSLRVLPDGKRVMTCNLYGRQVTFIDAQTYEILKRVPVGGEPVECTFTQGGKYAWVSLYGSERVGVTSIVVVIDTNSYQIVARIPAGRVPKVVADSPDGKWVYAANWLSESITVMDAEKFVKVKDVFVGRVPRGICFAPDGKLAYVCIMGGASLAVIDVENGHQKVRDIPTGPNPRHVCVSQDGTTLYVALNASGTLIKIDRATETITGRAKTGTQARSTSLSVDDRYAFVCNYEDNNLGVVDLEQMKQIFTAKTDIHPIGVTTMPDGQHVWVSNYRPSTVYVFKIEYAGGRGS